MNAMVRLSPLFLLAFSLNARAQSPAPTPAPVKKKAAKKPEAPTAPAASMAANAAAPAAEVPRVVFPDWAPESFDWSVSPVLGFQFSNTAALTSTQAELGLGLGLRGLPLVPGNPGVTLAPSVGYAVGYAVQKPKGLDVQRGLYHRGWVGAELPILVKFYKHTLGVRYGSLWGEVVKASRELEVSSDSGVLILPFMAAHYTYTRNALYAVSLENKVSLVHDNWWHLRLFTSVLNSFVDFGPGYEVAYAFAGVGANAVRTDAATTYFLGRAGAEVLPRFLEAEAQSRYAFDNETSLAAPVGVRRPSQDLGAPPAALGQPADSLVSSVFVGWKNALMGMSLGYRYNIEVYNVSEKDGTRRQTRTSQGIGLHASTRL